MLAIASPHPLAFHSLFDSAFDDLFDHAHRPLSLLRPHPTQGAASLSKTEDGYILSVAAPGVNTSELEISCDNGVLSLAGASSSNGSHVRFHRQLSLPDDADVERASVTHENGLVHVSLPQKPHSEPRSLELVPPSEQPAPDDSTHYRVALPAAGVAPRDLTITVLEDEVKVRGRSKPHGVEYSVDRVLSLPHDANAEGATASLVDGILTLTVPKRARSAVKQLLVSSTGVA